jgi:ADP-ribosylglycohydrolase
MITLNRQEYLDRVLGCWLGKSIGGTLGAPFEWRRQVNDVHFYTQELGGEPFPNDDLDIQLLWLVALEEQGVGTQSHALDAHTLANYWLLYVTPHWAEYGTAKANLRAGLLPPLSGTYQNVYKDSCGAFIRSEIWACIAPGAPQVAARYAYEDAIIDHGNGEGTFAEVFCAALESAAFVIQDIPTLVQIGLSYIPEDCGVAGAVRLAVDLYREGCGWRAARDRILEAYRASAYAGDPIFVSAEDQAKGFAEGRFGWDVPSNIGMLLIGLLYGEGDFSRSICTAVNCGEDTDCTGATVGALFGILHGAKAIPESWIAPIGHKIKTACLNLGELGYFGNQLPADLDDLTARTARQAQQVIERSRLAIQICDQDTDLSGLEAARLSAGDLRQQLFASLNGPVFQFRTFQVQVDYGPEGPAVQAGMPKAIRLRVVNQGKAQSALNIRWYTPANWQIAPAGDISRLSFPRSFRSPLEIEYTLVVSAGQGAVQRAAVEITQAGWPETLLAPVVILLI